MDPMASIKIFGVTFAVIKRRKDIMSTLADLQTAVTNVKNAADGLAQSVTAVQNAFAQAKANAIDQATLDSVVANLNSASTELSNAVLALGALAA